MRVNFIRSVPISDGYLMFKAEISVSYRKFQKESRSDNGETSWVGKWFDMAIKSFLGQQVLIARQHLCLCSSLNSNVKQCARIGKLPTPVTLILLLFIYLYIPHSQESFPLRLSRGMRSFTANSEKDGI